MAIDILPVYGGPHGNDQDVGSNPAAVRPPYRRWPNGLNRISVEDRRCKSPTRPVEKKGEKEGKKTQIP